MNRRVSKNLIQAERLYKRVWRAANEAEATEIESLIRILDSQLTVNESNRIPMEKLKELWARFKVQVSFVAGAIVVATAYGTCSFDPSQTSTDAEEPAAEEAAAESALSTEPTTETTAPTPNSTTLEEAVEIDETTEEIETTEAE